MWNSRGDGSFRPRGAAQFLFTGSSVAMQASPDTPFPNTLNTIGQFENKGYRIDRSTALPVFLYTKDTLKLEDKIIPSPSGNSLDRTLRFTNDTPPDQYFAKLAEGEQIEELPNGIYVIDKQYYIQIQSGQNGVVRTQNGKKELLSKLTGSELTYTINW